MRETLPEQTIFDSDSKLSSAFTAAVTNILTITAHGYKVGDCIWVSSATTLPAGLSASTNYYVIQVLGVDTLKISATPGGPEVDITDTGTGIHTAVLKGKVIDVESYNHVVVSLGTAGSANFKYYFRGATQSNVNLHAAQAAKNRWDYLDTVDLNSKTAVGGDTGYTLSGTDDNRLFEVNTNGFKWLTIEVSNWSAGTLEAAVTCYNE